MDKKKSKTGAKRKTIPTHRLIFRILLAMYLCCLLALCFWNFQSLPDVQKSFFGIPTDKIVHFCMFLPFPILLFCAYDNLTTKPWQSAVFSVGTFLIGCLLAAGTEIGQSMTTYRTGDPNDFRADALALAISSIIVLIIDLRKQFVSPKTPKGESISPTAEAAPTSKPNTFSEDESLPGSSE